VVFEILGTQDGIKALAKFFLKLGAFTHSGREYTAPPLPSFSEEPKPPDVEMDDDD